MHIYIDESGNFTSGINVVCSVIIPDTIWGHIKWKYRKEFERHVPDSELIDSEVKGSGLSFSSRKASFNFLNSYPDIKITPISIDLDSQNPEDSERFIQDLAASYSQAIQKAIETREFHFEKTIL